MHFYKKRQDFIKKRGNSNGLPSILLKLTVQGQLEITTVVLDLDAPIIEHGKTLRFHFNAFKIYDHFPIAPLH